MKYTPILCALILMTQISLVMAQEQKDGSQADHSTMVQDEEPQGSESTQEVLEMLKDRSIETPEAQKSWRITQWLKSLKNRLGLAFLDTRIGGALFNWYKQKFCNQ